MIVGFTPNSFFAAMSNSFLIYLFLLVIAVGFSLSVENMFFKIFLLSLIGVVGVYSLLSMTHVSGGFSGMSWSMPTFSIYRANSPLFNPWVGLILFLVVSAALIAAMFFLGKGEGDEGTNVLFMFALGIFSLFAVTWAYKLIKANFFMTPSSLITAFSPSTLMQLLLYFDYIVFGLLLLAPFNSGTAGLIGGALKGSGKLGWGGAKLAGKGIGKGVGKGVGALFHLKRKKSKKNKITSWSQALQESAKIESDISTLMNILLNFDPNLPNADVIINTLIQNIDDLIDDLNDIHSQFNIGPQVNYPQFPPNPSPQPQPSPQPSPQSPQNNNIPTPFEVLRGKNQEISNEFHVPVRNNNVPGFAKYAMVGAVYRSPKKDHVTYGFSVGYAPPSNAQKTIMIPFDADLKLDKIDSIVRKMRFKVESVKADNRVHPNYSKEANKLAKEIENYFKKRTLDFSY